MSARLWSGLASNRFSSIACVSNPRSHSHLNFSLLPTVHPQTLLRPFHPSKVSHEKTMLPVDLVRARLLYLSLLVQASRSLHSTLKLLIKTGRLVHQKRDCRQLRREVQGQQTGALAAIPSPRLLDIHGRSPIRALVRLPSATPRHRTNWMSSEEEPV